MSVSSDLENDAYRVTVGYVNGQIEVRLYDKTMDYYVADGRYLYQAVTVCEEGSTVFEELADASAEATDEVIIIRGKLAGLDLEQSLRLPSARPILEEQISLHNRTQDIVTLKDFACGMQCPITNDVGAILPEMKSDRIAAIPFRHQATDPVGWDNDFDLGQLLSHTGRELRVNEIAPLEHGHGYVPSMQRFSEGWAWSHGEHTLGVFKFNQEAMEFSVLSTVVDDAGVALRFGGAGMRSGDPSSLRSIEPGESVELGVTRLETVQGGYTQASYAFRAFLDESGCRFPDGFNPPVHWNELYDNPEWSLGTPGHPEGRRMTRPLTYTRELLLEEAAKARDYGCESLYLDPGWDTDFGTFLWGEEWLGNRKQFVRDVWERYGLRVSLHCPLATWMSFDGRGVSSWPREACRMDKGGNLIYIPSWSGEMVASICLGSRQYLDEAERRLLAHCADGVVYLMFDGNWWNGGCWNPDHGHPVPYTMEDHCRANLDLACRIHAKYPDVVIEMHDMITGGSIMRYTPVYYKYGLPGSYDDNWGYELMWQPMEDIRSGRARALYYYNLGCNVPVYLHVDLRGDNEHCLVLWWYASTCRHLGIGGTHDDPRIAEAHKKAMKRYRRLDRFYKRGDFYGVSEELHIHALPAENAFVVNLFNLSDESRIISATVGIEEMGLDRNRWYVNPKGGRFDANEGTFTISRRLPPWSARVAEVRALEHAG